MTKMSCVHTECVVLDTNGKIFSMMCDLQQESWHTSNADSHPGLSLQCLAKTLLCSIKLSNAWQAWPGNIVSNAYKQMAASKFGVLMTASALVMALNLFSGQVQAMTDLVNKCRYVR